ncbi:hypothetical protein [Methylobacterium ajmalii]|jgi:hypothetical protein|uniref:hypothetical protein n=1 Tax=Methylobacterium ajmalii TaxID=2738439 RepID=UPI00190D22EF|nr:hypothetical protein [Methylobacterium ajmalii]MBK3400830.1 hypothetical protein [Methylobacterium ajmalii]MBK3412272.1 hypothetical protein [Methylobacterium ajmalii]MBK3426887.1 hypothetical protein [Methylobacterium ajmalii]MBZ6416928.1 hypothetical protein [Methylobacterium sp.]
MSRPATTPTAPAFHGTDAAVFEALTEALIAAQTYAATGADFAGLHDRRGAVYAIKCAGACLANAASLLEEIKPARRPKAGEAA